MDTLSLLQELVSIPAPPGEEGKMRQFLHKVVEGEQSEDERGNLIFPNSNLVNPRIVVTAHMDEIAMIVRSVHSDGSLTVGPLGGIYPWKCGEGPVLIMGANGNVDGVLSIGSIHTESPESFANQAKAKALDWSMCRVITGLRVNRLVEMGIRPGTRVVVHPSRRHLVKLGELVGGYFLDDRADLVSLIQLQHSSSTKALLAATASEETGGEGSLFLMQKIRPDICIALELGPNVPDSPVEINDQPTLWVNDGYSAMQAADIDLACQVAKSLGLELQLQALSRGGSDASCAASHGLCARPFTLGIPMENSHGYEVIHPEAIDNLTKLTKGLVEALI